MTKKTRKALALIAALTIGTGAVTSLAGCGGDGGSSSGSGSSQASSASTADIGSKKLVFGTAAYSTAEGGIDPALSYASWSPFRYGIAECLVTFDENMTVQPWLAKSFEQKDAKTWVFEINDGVKFHSGKACDGAAVKAGLERTIKMNTGDSSKGGRNADIKNLLIDKITAEGNTVIITTTEENPILANLLCDPLFCIIDASADIKGQDDVYGTGPYKLVKATEEGCTVEANTEYWNGSPKIGKIEIKKITDGDTNTMALQKGEVDISQELPVSSIALFKNDDYTVSTNATSRTSNMIMNTRSKILSDVKVRQAIAYGFDKQDFIDALMSGYGQSAIGFFPQSFTGFGDTELKDTYTFNVEEAKKLLKEAGWEDTDGDGYVDKDGKNLELKYYSYSSRQDLPLLGEAFQDDMKDIGIKVDLNIAESGPETDALKTDKIQWDINVFQMVTAPNGDPLYMIDSALGDGGYYATGGTEKDTELQGWIDDLRKETDIKKRGEIAVKIQQKAVDEVYMIEAFHKEQTLVMKKGVTGISQHPTDQHEISVDTDIN